MGGSWHTHIMILVDLCLNISLAYSLTEGMTYPISILEIHVRQLLVSEFEQKVQQGYSFATGEAWVFYGPWNVSDISGKSGSSDSKMDEFQREWRIWLSSG